MLKSSKIAAAVAPLYRPEHLGYDESMGTSIPAPRLEGGKLIVEALNRVWHLDHSQSLEDLWANMDAHDLADERIPYWAELWPSSFALVLLLAERQEEMSKGLCVDLGCGCGFTAMAAASLGINVLACDYLPAGLACARANASANGVHVKFACMDWRNPAVAPASIWRIWASDILYERRAFEPVLDCLDHALQPAGHALIAEPGRELFKDFLLLAREKGWRTHKAAASRVNDLYAENIPVTVWEFFR